MGTTIRSTSDQPTGTSAGTIARLGGAAALLVSGLVHIQLYFDEGYRSIPVGNIGRAFLLQFVASVAVAIALVVTRHLAVRAAGIAALGGTLIAFAFSRSSGFFGFTESGLNPSPGALLSLLAGIIGIVLLAATFVPAIGAGKVFDARVAAGGAAAVLAVSIIGPALWAQSDAPGEVAGPSSESPSPTTATPGTEAPTSTAPGATTMPDMSMPGSSMPGEPTTTAAATPPTDGAAAETTAPAEDGVMEIRIVEFAFDSADLEIPVGTTVRWTNEDSAQHNVVSDDGSFKSETLATGDVFEFTFDTAGEFPYICGFHPFMTATITVTG